MLSRSPRSDPSFVRPHRFAARPRTPCAAARLERRHLRPRTPSIGSMPSFWSRVRHERFPCLEFARSRPAPFSPDAKQLPRQGFSRRIALPPFRFSTCLSARRDEREEDATYRSLQPTFTTRAPVGVSIREHVAFAYTDRQHRVVATSRPQHPGAGGATQPCGGAAPRRHALDGAHRASVPSRTGPLISELAPSTAPGSTPIAAAFSTTCKVGDEHL